VSELAEGRHLFETQGCRGCHKLNGVGGSIGPDLSEEVRVCGLRSGLRNTS
jgi:cytochrome c2